MTEIIDCDVVDVTAPDELPYVGVTDHSDFHAGLFEADGEAMRQQYFETSHDGSRAKAWKHEDKVFCKKIVVNGSTDEALKRIKTILPKTLERLRTLSEVGPSKEMKEKDFLNVWFDRDCYLVVIDEIKAKIADPELHPKPFEIREMFRVFLLMMIHRETAHTLFQQPEWYPKIKDVKISYQRYKFLFEKLGAGMPEVDLFVHDDDDESQQKIWGSFEQHNPSIKKMEMLIGSTGAHFMFDGDVCGITVDDDKLRHSSRSFHEENLQMTGFRGSKYGPVMNGAGIVENGIIASVHFSRHGDGPLHNVKSLFRNVGYGVSDDDNTLKKKLKMSVKLDRGYHIELVNEFLGELGASWLGTHSEKVDDWPFASEAKEKKANQKYVSKDGVQTASWAHRQKYQIKGMAVCYRSGTSSIGNVHFSDQSMYGVWELERPGPFGSLKGDIVKPCYEDGSVQSRLFGQWDNRVFELTSVQAATPWFDLRHGFLTGTTYKNALGAVKYTLLSDDEYGDRMLPLFNLVGMKDNRPSEQRVQSLSAKELEKAYHKLGYSDKPSVARMRLVVRSQIPSDELVFEKIVKSWCMSPIKKKSKAIIEAFRQGRLAEEEINKSIPSFISHHTNGLLAVTHQRSVGLMQSMDCHTKIAAVSPDQMGAMRCRLSANEDHDTSIAAADARKLDDFFRRERNKYISEHVDTLRQRSDSAMDESDDSSTSESDSSSERQQDCHFLSAFEYKHKSANLTISRTQTIVQETLNGNRVRVLDLGNDLDAKTFHKAVPSSDYRSQVIHEAVVCGVGSVVFAVGVAQIEYVIVALIPSSIAELSKEVIRYISDNHLSFLFKRGTTDFDKTLSRFPTYTNVNWGHAGSREAVIARLQIMMCVYELRVEVGFPLPECRRLLPRPIKSWNISKGAIDDLSKVLAHCLPKFGRISALNTLWIRIFSTMFYNGWRAFGLAAAERYIMSNRCNTHMKFLHERQRLGGTFENFLKTIFDTMELPASLLGVASMSPGRPVRGARHSSIVFAERPAKKQRVSREDWSENAEWANFRLSNAGKHVLTSMAHIHDVDSTFPVTKDPRRHCKFCTTSARIDDKIKHVSVFDGEKPKKVSTFCFECREALCDKPPTTEGVHSTTSCHQLWHHELRLPHPQRDGE